MHSFIIHITVIITLLVSYTRCMQISDDRTTNGMLAMMSYEKRSKLKETTKALLQTDPEKKIRFVSSEQTKYAYTCEELHKSIKKFEERYGKNPWPHPYAIYTWKSTGSIPWTLEEERSVMHRLGIYKRLEIFREYTTEQNIIRRMCNHLYHYENKQTIAPNPVYRDDLNPLDQLKYALKHAKLFTKKRIFCKEEISRLDQRAKSLQFYIDQITTPDDIMNLDFERNLDFRIMMQCKSRISPDTDFYQTPFQVTIKQMSTNDRSILKQYLSNNNPLYMKALNIEKILGQRIFYDKDFPVGHNVIINVMLDQIKRIEEEEEFTRFFNNTLSLNSEDL